MPRNRCTGSSTRPRGKAPSTGRRLALRPRTPSPPRSAARILRGRRPRVSRGGNRVRFGLHTGQHHVTFPDLSSLWRSAGEWGFDACYVFDHFVPLHSDIDAFLPEEADRPDGPCLEATALLAALARA